MTRSISLSQNLPTETACRWRTRLLEIPPPPHSQLHQTPHSERQVSSKKGTLSEGHTNPNALNSLKIMLLSLLLCVLNVLLVSRGTCVCVREGVGIVICVGVKGDTQRKKLKFQI